MDPENRFSRRLMGMLSARLPEAEFDELDDPRKSRGRRWDHGALLGLMVVGLGCGVRSLAQLERLSAEMSPVCRKRLGIQRRVPDTTARDLICQEDPNELRQGLHRIVRAAHRRKALEPDGLPFGVVSIDGKSTAIHGCDDNYAQRQSNDTRLVGLVRTATCALVSAAAVPCIDVVSIPAETNEMGAFESVLRSLYASYSSLKLFRLVSYDAGACSLHNAGVVRELGLDYLFALKDSQPTLRTEAERLLATLAPSQASASTEDVTGIGTVVRRVYLTEEMADFCDWTHLRTVVRIESETLNKKGERMAHENRYYLSSVKRATLSDNQWLMLVRKHWGVENNCHHTLDTAFAEDDHPWIQADPRGALVVMVLRRIAYTILTLFRRVTQRSENRRAIPWAVLLDSLRYALIRASEALLVGLRTRTLALPV